MTRTVQAWFVLFAGAVAIAIAHWLTGQLPAIDLGALVLW